MKTDQPRNNPTSRYIPRIPAPHPDGLELAADLLLLGLDPDPEYPAYTESQLAGRGRRARRTLRCGSPCDCADALLESELDDLTRSAGLSGEERSAWKLMLDGSPPDEIARELGTSRTRAVRLVSSARKRVASSGSQARGIYSAYLSLVRAYIYRPA